MIEANIGRFGPYVKHGPSMPTSADVDEVFTIGMNRAVEVLAQKAHARRAGCGCAPLRELGDAPRRRAWCR
jgi:DNA topoisomerase I